MQVLAEDVLGNIYRTQPRQCPGTLELLQREVHVLHRQDDRAEDALRVFHVQRRGGVVNRPRELRPKRGRRPQDMRVRLREDRQIDVAVVHHFNNPIGIRHLAAKPGARGIGVVPRDRGLHRTVFVAANVLHAVRRPFFFN